VGTASDLRTAINSCGTVAIGFHLILDNFRIHDRHKTTTTAVAALNGRVKLYFLPPYCPDHNAMERIWRDLPENVARHRRYEASKELMDEIYACLRRRRDVPRHKYATCCAA
jgi:transposase